MATASISQLLSRPNSTTFSSPSLSSSKTLVSISNTNFKAKTQRFPFISCSTKDANNDTTSPKLDRRDILVGLSATALALTSAQNSLAADTVVSAADPFPLPKFDKCQQATLPSRNNVTAFPPTNCCPSFRTDQITDFTLPPRSLPLRVRPAAHLADQAYIDKYNTALNKMRNLPCADPRSFSEQAKIHCAYCNGFYPQPGSDIPLQIHNGALFFPWHRIYLYFYERILCTMIDDDHFAIPYWNWDAELGMRIPEMFVPQKFGDKKSYLYNENREPTRYGKTIDLSYVAKRAPPGTSDKDLVKLNLAAVNRQVVNQAAPQFFGRHFKSGVENKNTGAGSIEANPHTDVHAWIGDPAKGGQDMGQFYSAGRDPIFYAHHANVDRLWSIWKNLGGQEFNDKGWLDSEFLFFDEQAKLRRCTVAQSLDTTKLRYNYQDVALEWLDTPPTVTRRARSKRSAAPPAFTDLSSFPVVLSSAINVKVPRQQGISGKKEVLVVDGIEVEPNELVSFAVYINTPDHEQIAADGREFAGSFVTLPLHHRLTTNMHFTLNDVLRDLGADSDDDIVVTIVPNEGIGMVKIGGIHIEMQD